MTDRFDPRTAAGLDAALGELGMLVDWPPTPDLAARVTERLGAARPTAVSSEPARVAGRPIKRSLPRALLLAAAIALLLAGAVLGVRFGLDLLSIEFGPPPPSASPHAGAPSPSVSEGASVGSPGVSVSPGSPTGTGLGLGRPATLEAASAGAGFPVLVPAELGPPDAVYQGDAARRGQIAFVYAPRDDLPASELLEGAGLLVTQARGRADEGLVSKIVDSGRGDVERVVVGGDEGYWFHGAPHWFWYVRPDGSIIEESRRFVGDTLVWQRGDVLYRIEGELELEQALALAASMQVP